MEVDTMDKRRAKDIAASPVMANVTYNGAQIYIENVNENNETANIYPLNQPDNRKEVPVTSLVEH
jgi:small acid-soluble spore protein H (minor)